MNVKRSIVPVVLAAAMSVLSACGANTRSFAYIHDPETEILSLSDNGKAVYKDSNYSYTMDDSFITLKGDDGSEMKLRYVPDDKDENRMILYEKSTYDFDGEGTPNGVIGSWKQDNGWTFEFTTKGTFAEENIFFGHYAVDEKEGTIKLMYDEPIEDALLYYSVDGNSLTIDYPWPMVKTGSGDGAVDKGTAK